MTLTGTLVAPDRTTDGIVHDLQEDDIRSTACGLDVAGGTIRLLFDIEPTCEQCLRMPTFDAAMDEVYRR